MASAIVERRTVSSSKPPLYSTGPNNLHISLDELPELYSWPRRNNRGYEIKEQPFGTELNFRVIHIGAGASGICFAKFAETSLNNVSFQLYEKNSDVGGTWLENRYPGCACDIPSANYQFSWERNPNWTKFYSGAREIWQYFKDTTEKNGLNKYIKLNHKVVGATWIEEEALWHVKIKPKGGEEFEDTCNILINGSGILNNWKWPKIPGLDTFQGVLQHSANYDETISLNDKRVAVIGIGSSGVQIISTISKTVSKLYTWARSPTWITAGFAQAYAGPDGGNFEYTKEQKENFTKNPKEFLRYSKTIENELNQRFKFILNGTPEAKSAMEYARNEMNSKLSSSPALAETLIPKTFGVGCRRPTPGNGFLEALVRPNATVFREEIKCITPKGFKDSAGKEYEVDVIICATGFDTSWVPRFPVVANERNLQDLWREDLYSYFAIAVPEMPNYFTSGGPYGPFGHGSFLPIIESYYKYFVQVIQKMQKENIKSIAPKMELAMAFKEHADLFLKRTAWSSGCSSWFKQGKVDGPLPMFPGSRIMYLELLRTPRYEDYIIKYSNPLNCLEFLGNGFSTTETSPDNDLSFYLGTLD